MYPAWVAYSGVIISLTFEPDDTAVILNLCLFESPPVDKELSCTYSVPPSCTITSIVWGTSYPLEPELIVCVAGDALVKTFGTAFFAFVYDTIFSNDCDVELSPARYSIFNESEPLSLLVWNADIE